MSELRSLFTILKYLLALKLFISLYLLEISPVYVVCYVDFGCLLEFLIDI